MWWGPSDSAADNASATQAPVGGDRSTTGDVDEVLRSAAELPAQGMDLDALVGTGASGGSAAMASTSIGTAVGGMQAEPSAPVSLDEPWVDKEAKSGMESKRQFKSVKGEGSDCSICFAPLPTEQVCVLIRQHYGKKRSCRHYHHLGCVRLMMQQTPAPHLCPLCRGKFERVEAMPDVRLNSRAWFKTVDTDEGGALEKSEVIDALSATLPVDPELLTQKLEGELWDQWDTGKTGRITLEAFEEPGKGLLHFVLYSLPSLRYEGGMENKTAAVPDVVESREGWFRYWDENCRHMLEFLQFLRALVLTWRLDGAKEDAGILRSVLTTVWQEFGLIETQDVLKPVSFALFCEKPDGFCDVMLDALNKKFGAAKFRRIRQRARLLQQPAAALKRELRKLNGAMPDGGAIEKDELVSAILDAQLQEEPPTSPPLHAPQAFVFKAEKSIGADTTMERTCTDELKALTIKQLKERLEALAVPYGHCLEREELEDLLTEHGDNGRGPLPARPQPPRQMQRGDGPNGQTSSTSPGTASNDAARSDSQQRSASASSASRAAPGQATTGGAQRPARPNQPIPTVTEPSSPDDAVRSKRCMMLCALQ